MRKALLLLSIILLACGFGGVRIVGGGENASSGGPTDTDPPLRATGSPSGTLSAGTTSTNISLTTSEPATCRYGTTSGVAYGSIPNTFSTTGVLFHSQNITGLTNGTSYSYYVRCIDLAGNANPDDYVISFSVASGGAVAGQEQRCSDLGSACVCSTPMKSTSYTIALVGGNGEWIVPDDYGWSKQCYNDQHPSSASLGSMLFPKTGGWSVRTHANAEFGVSTSASDVPAILSIDGNKKGEFYVTRSVNDADAVTQPVARLCQRWYMKWSNSTIDNAILKTCNQKHSQFETPTSNPRVVMKHSGGQIGIVTKGFSGSETTTNDITRTNENGWTDLRDCRAEWCRYEMCIASTDYPDNWSNMVIEAEVTTVETGKRSYFIANNIPANPSGSGLEYHIAISLFRHLNDGTGGNGDDDPDCSMIGNWRGLTHYMMGAWSTNSGQWIGAACEVEGGCP